MEEIEMSKYIAAIAGVAVLALALSSSVNAGSSSSAPSKYKNQVASQQQTKQTFPITEYSSSSRTTSQKH
jgi:hypothetical protein